MLNSQHVTAQCNYTTTTSISVAGLRSIAFDENTVMSREQTELWLWSISLSGLMCAESNFRSKNLPV